MHRNRKGRSIPCRWCWYHTAVPTQSSSPFVSVVVAVKDNPTGLAATLCSLQLQNAPDLQVIAIDGGSDAPTLAVLDRYSGLLAYRESGLDSGIADAFNRGIAQATGRYVAILNSGDTWTADTLARVRDAVRNADCPDVLHGDVRFVRSDGSTYVVQSDRARHHQRAYLFHPALFVRRDCYASVGGYDSSYLLAMDAEWCHRAMVKGTRFAAVRAVLANMELGGISDARYAEALREFRRSVIDHRLASPAAAWFHYLRVLAGKRLRALLRGGR